MPLRNLKAHVDPEEPPHRSLCPPEPERHSHPRPIEAFGGGSRSREKPKLTPRSWRVNVEPQLERQIEQVASSFKIRCSIFNVHVQSLSNANGIQSDEWSPSQTHAHTRGLYRSSTSFVILRAAPRGNMWPQQEHLLLQHKGGRCETCKGADVKLEMNFMPDTHVTCEDCNGRRYGAELEDLRWMARASPTSTDELRGSRRVLQLPYHSVDSTCSW